MALIASAVVPLPEPSRNLAAIMLAVQFTPVTPSALLPMLPIGRGRDADCSAPPAQTRAGAFNAHGSYLGCLASKRADGYGCRMQTSGSRAPSRSRKRSQVHRLRWLRRRI